MKKQRLAPRQLQPSGASAGNARKWLVVLGLALLTLAIYGRVARAHFVDYDDSDYVTANPHVQTGLTWENLTWAFTTGHASNWHPLTWISHQVDCQLFGTAPGPAHVVNLLLHLANTLLLLLFLQRVTGKFWRSALLAAFFALHPLHVESVAWISERKDVLSTFFLFLTFLAYERYVRPAPGTRAQSWYLAALGLFALGLMSKPMLVTTPFLLLLLDWWPFSRVGLWAEPPDELPEPKLKPERKPSAAPPAPIINPAGRESISWLLLEKLPFFILSLVSSIITFLVQRHGGAVSTALPLGARVGNALVSYVRYIAKTLVPVRLSVLYPHPGHWPLWEVLCSALLLAAITAACLWMRRRYLLTGWLWFIGGLVPVIGLVQVGIQSMADRYSYVPSLGLFVMVVWGGWELAERLLQKRKEQSERAAWRTGFILLSVASLAFCAAATAKQAGHWHDSEALFRHAVNVTRSNYLACNNLGFFLAAQGRTNEAMEQYEKSLAINPSYEDALNNLGYAYAGKKQYAQAIPYYERALRTKPKHAEVNNNLGNSLSELGQLDHAIACYRVVLEQNPEHADAHNNLGIALAMEGKLDEAIPHFRAALKYKRDYASAHSNLGNALAAQHKLDEAIAEYRECLRLKPNDAQAHNNLGNAFSEQGKLDEAIAQYQEALRLNSDNPESEFNYGMALLRKNQLPEAAAHFQQALKLKPDYAAAQTELREIQKRMPPAK